MKRSEVQSELSYNKLQTAGEIWRNVITEL